MAPQSWGRTQPASAADADAYLAKASEFLRAAQDALQLGNHTAATGNAVHAGIAAADAIAAARSGSIWRGPHDHGVLHGIAAALPVFRRQGQGHLVTSVSTAGLKIVPTQAVYAATKNAVRTLLEGLRQESTDGVLRTTSVSPGYVRTELAHSIDDAVVRDQIRRGMDEFAIAPEAVARAIAFAIEQPQDVEIGDITIRPTIQA